MPTLIATVAFNPMLSIDPHYMNYWWLLQKSRGAFQLLASLGDTQLQADVIEPFPVIEPNIPYSEQ